MHLLPLDHDSPTENIPPSTVSPRLPPLSDFPSFAPTATPAPCLSPGSFNGRPPAGAGTPPPPAPPSVVAFHPPPRHPHPTPVPPSGRRPPAGARATRAPGRSPSSRPTPPPCLLFRVRPPRGGGRCGCPPLPAFSWTPPGGEGLLPPVPKQEAAPPTTRPSCTPTPAAPSPTARGSGGSCWTQAAA